LKCYAALTAMAFVGLHRHRALLLIATLLVVLATIIYVRFFPVGVIDTWQLLMPCFLLGVCMYIYQAKIPWSPLGGGLSFLLSLVFLSQYNELMIFAAFPITYLTVWLGLFNPRRGALISSGDYSYPLYLYSFPIQQMLFAVVPGGKVWWVNLLLAVPVTFIFAAMSWHLIEKPAQSGRRWLFQFEAWHQKRTNAQKSSSSDPGF
jgi:peptidoglycan/LPS O-acetylase OafA/YrhL